MNDGCNDNINDLESESTNSSQYAKQLSLPPGAPVTVKPKEIQKKTNRQRKSDESVDTSIQPNINLLRGENVYSGPLCLPIDNARKCLARGCPSKGADLPLSKFHRNKSKVGGHESSCKDCISKKKSSRRIEKIKRFRNEPTWSHSFIGQPSEVAMSKFVEFYVHITEDLIDEGKI